MISHSLLTQMSEPAGTSIWRVEPLASMPEWRPPFGNDTHSVGVGGDRVNAEELAGLAPAAAEGRKLGHGAALDNAHALVLAIGQVDEALPRVLREGDLPSGARRQRVPGEEVLLLEFAVGSDTCTRSPWRSQT
jgi:hypothetical protein